MQPACNPRPSEIVLGVPNPVNLSAVTGATRASDDQFVLFGPEQARKAHEAAGLPEPTEAPPDASVIRRLWIWLTRGNGEERKLWASGTRDDNT